MPQSQTMFISLVMRISPRQDHFAALLTLSLIISIMCSSCGDPSAKKNSALTIVTTTGMIEDITRNIVGDKASVQALMGSGVDPHLYKATANDLDRLNAADIVLYNGIHLEGKMAEVLEKLAQRKAVIPVGECIPENQLRKVSETQHDPHIWFNVQHWRTVTLYIAQKIQAIDTTNAAYYQANAQRFAHQLDSLDTWVRGQIAIIPEQQRVLITAHDAFGYFGAAYNIQVVGLQGISTVSEFGVQDVVHLVDMITERNIKAVFVESSVPKRSIEAVVEGVKARGKSIAIGGQLYSDAMGERGTPDGSYIGMVSANVRTIVNALK